MVSYAERLSVISDKGLCGDREIIDNPQITFANVQKLSLLIKQSNYCIIHTGNTGKLFFNLFRSWYFYKRWNS